QTCALPIYIASKDAEPVQSDHAREWKRVHPRIDVQESLESESEDGRDHQHRPTRPGDHLTGRTPLDLDEEDQRRPQAQGELRADSQPGDGRRGDLSQDHSSPPAMNTSAIRPGEGTW